MDKEDLRDGMFVYCKHNKTTGAIRIINNVIFFCSDNGKYNGRDCGSNKYGHKYSYYIGETNRKDSLYRYMTDNFEVLSCNGWDSEKNFHKEEV